MPQGESHSLSEPPYRLCCGQQHYGPQCPDGHVMCCICFERHRTVDLYTDEHGDMWDVCYRCAAQEGL